MPARKTKTYLVVTGPNASEKAAVPENPKRIGLRIQNTSINPGTARFGGPTQANGSDMAFSAGLSEKWDQSDTCPLESVNLSSVLVATWSVVETVTS